MRFLLRLALLAATAAMAGLVFVYSGLADVAATSPHWAVTEWVLSTTLENAVEKRAGNLSLPAFVSDQGRVRAGLQAYDAMCAVCHGAPGVEPDVFAEGLNPPPPDLSEEAAEWTLAELFWITKHGIRMTGMPAFGPTHSDAELWEVAAAVARLPELSPAEYRKLSGAASGSDPRAGDAHRHEGHAH